MTVPLVQDVTAGALATFLPAAASRVNPVDMLAAASASDYEHTLRLMIADPGIDAVVVIYVPTLVTPPADVALAIAAAAPGAHGKPSPRSSCRQTAAPAELGHIPSYRFPEAAARALARAAAYGAWRQRPDVVAVAAALPPECRQVVDQVQARGGGWLRSEEVAALLGGAGIHLVPGRNAADDAEAIAVAEQLGYPVALKAIGPTLLHKSDVGGVRLDLRDRQELLTAARAMREALGPRLEAFQVQAMAPAGVELLVGCVHDETFGPVVLCSLGGTLVELLRTPIARLAPLSSLDVDDILDQMPGKELLHGYRGRPPADLAALRDLLERVSSLATHCPEILEMDLNPARVFANGLCVLDARVRIGVPPAHDDRRISY